MSIPTGWVILCPFFTGATDFDFCLSQQMVRELPSYEFALGSQSQNQINYDQLRGFEQSQQVPASANRENYLPSANFFQKNLAAGSEINPNSSPPALAYVPFQAQSRNSAEIILPKTNLPREK